MESQSKETTNIGSSSLVEQVVQLFCRLLRDIWNSPINLLLSGLIIFLFVKLIRLRRKPSAQHNQNKVPVQLPKMPKCDLTVQELRGYNGIESNGRILTAIYGDIFDVSKRSDLYGIGGSYSLFAGRDATRALSKMQLDPSLFSSEYDDLLDLTDKERATARSWYEDFREKYDVVGRLLRPGEQAQVYPVEEIRIDDDYSPKHKKIE